jgi:hypothetical protein
MEDDYNMFDKLRGYSMRDELDYLSSKLDKYSVYTGVDSASKSGYYSDYVEYKRLHGAFERKRRGYYSYDVETSAPETAVEKSARLLREKAVKRNDKIDKLLGDGGL